MYITGIGRCSGVLHLAVLYPKTTIMACVMAVGLTTTPGWATLKSPAAVVEYCQSPTQEHLMALPKLIRPTVNRVCGCLKNACSSQIGLDSPHPHHPFGNLFGNWLHHHR